MFNFDSSQGKNSFFRQDNFQFNQDSYNQQSQQLLQNFTNFNISSNQQQQQVRSGSDNQQYEIIQPVNPTLNQLIDQVTNKIMMRIQPIIREEIISCVTQSINHQEVNYQNIPDVELDVSNVEKRPGNKKGTSLTNPQMNLLKRTAFWIEFEKIAKTQSTYLDSDITAQYKQDIESLNHIINQVLDQGNMEKQKKRKLNSQRIYLTALHIQEYRLDQNLAYMFLKWVIVQNKSKFKDSLTSMLNIDSSKDQSQIISTDDKLIVEALNLYYSLSYPLKHDQQQVLLHISQIQLLSGMRRSTFKNFSGLKNLSQNKKKEYQNLFLL